jgi:hypothetical protein
MAESAVCVSGEHQLISPPAGSQRRTHHWPCSTSP